jgi:uroporphyrinogen-III decarboxylase
MEISRNNIAKWVKQSHSPVFLFHDDIAMTRGLVFSKEWYLKEIIPRYEQILEPAFQSGKKLVFISDGNYMDLIPEIMSLGIHGLMIDLSNDLEWVLKTYGMDHVVIGNINTMTLTFGTRDDIRHEVQRCANLGKLYPGYFFKSSGDLPHNIPLDNISYYFDLKAKLGIR